jgi:hypothetical protein
VKLRSTKRTLLKDILTGLAALAISGPLAAQAPVSTTVKVEVFNSAPTFYTASWSSGMSVLNVLEQALPTTSPSGSFSVNFFPQFGGYMITAIGGVPAAGVQKFWSTCLLPAASGSTVFALPLAVNRILVSPGDLVILAYNADCTKLPAPSK